jgi:hypothetical protein
MKRSKSNITDSVFLSGCQAGRILHVKKGLGFSKRADLIDQIISVSMMWTVGISRLSCAILVELLVSI